MTDKEMSESLDSFQRTLEAGLIKICDMSGLAHEMLMCPDIEERWDVLLKDYVADAVVNFNDFPDASIGFAAYLGMAVAAQWDKDWTHYKDKPYKSYCGDRGFDNMDDHIVADILHLDDSYIKKLSACILNCVEAALGLVQHEGIETQTRYGFFILVRCCCALYKTGASIELTRRGYKLEKVDIAKSSPTLS